MTSRTRRLILKCGMIFGRTQVNTNSFIDWLANLAGYAFGTETLAGGYGQQQDCRSAPISSSRVFRDYREGWRSFIGAVDDTTVLKYPLLPGDLKKNRNRGSLTPDPRRTPHNIAPKGLTEHGLLLQRALNGSLHDYIVPENSIPLSRKLLGCQQAAEAISYIHGKRIIHCDLHTLNLLLDENLDLLIADFQGILISAGGETCSKVIH